MNMPMCSRCKKNIAVVFITKIEGPDKTTQEGLCLKCARELGVKPARQHHGANGYHRGRPRSALR